MNKRMFNFSAHVTNVFAEENVEYEGLKNLMQDLYYGREIFDDETGRVISKKEANDKILSISHKIMGINENSRKMDRKVAYNKHGLEWFSIIAETVDDLLSTGFRDSEFFDQFVDYRNQALDDEMQFWTEKEIILNVAKAGRTHHDHILQRLGAREYTTIPFARYVAAVGANIDRFMLGKEDWSKLINAITRAFQVQIQDEIFEKVFSASAAIPAPAQFIATGPLTNATKAYFDEIIENVSLANGNVPVAIFGTQTALRNVSGLAGVVGGNADVHWIAPSQKEDVAHLGRLGDYEGHVLVEIPQRFARNDVTQKLYDNTKLLILPMGEDMKMVLMTDAGETLIDEITDRGEANGFIGDIMKYEIQRDYGIAVKLGRYFGCWTIGSSYAPGA